jgi:hypothetical protein
MRFQIHKLALLIIILPLLAYSKTEREHLQEEIKYLASNPYCNTASDCKSIGFGHRSCGGFDAFLIYSTQSVSADEMEGLLSRYYTLDEKYNRTQGGVSICAYEIPKLTACLNSKCIDLRGLAPIHWATEREDSTLIKKLHSEGADINSQSGDLNDTPLQHAIRSGASLGIIKTLINLGADVNTSQFPRNTTKHTPLHISTRAKRSELIKYLIEQEADKSAGGSSTPYNDAIYFYKDHPDYKEIMNLLRPTNCSGQNQCPPKN